MWNPRGGTARVSIRPSPFLRCSRTSPACLTSMRCVHRKANVNAVVFVMDRVQISRHLPLCPQAALEGLFDEACSLQRSHVLLTDFPVPPAALGAKALLAYRRGAIERTLDYSRHSLAEFLKDPRATRAIPCVYAVVRLIDIASELDGHAAEFHSPALADKAIELMKTGAYAATLRCCLRMSLRPARVVVRMQRRWSPSDSTEEQENATQLVVPLQLFRLPWPRTRPKWAAVSRRQLPIQFLHPTTPTTRGWVP